jgi:hypothetical protein
VTLAFYVSGHGFGHITREIEVINALRRRKPGLPLLIRTPQANRLFGYTLSEPASIEIGPCDPAVVQVDGLRLDPAETIRGAAAFYRTLGTRAGEEAHRLRASGVRLVVGDIPPLAFAAAATAAVPSVAIANFTWDWIYGGYPAELAAAPELVPAIRHTYGLATTAWRLPMGGGFAAFPEVLDLPLIARRARHSPEETRRTLGLPPDRPLVLVSFGGYDAEGLPVAALDCLGRYGVVVTSPGTGDGPAVEGLTIVAESAIYSSGLRYEDLVAAVDVVISKPGYGIVSECLANDTALLYTSRGRFLEYDAIVETMPRLLRCRLIEQDALFAGRWLDSLDALMAQPAPPERPPTNGADVAAERILGMIG